MSPRVVFLFTIALIATVYAGDEVLVLQQQQISMQTLFRNMQKLTLVSTDGSVIDISNDTMENCFSYIRRKRIEDLVHFQSQKQVCDKKASDAKDELSKQSEDMRDSLVIHSNLGCANMLKCEKLSDAVGFFSCYGRTTSTFSDDLKNMSFDSTEQVEDLQMEYTRIGFDKQTCDTNALKDYTAASAATDRQMTKCLDPTTGFSSSDAPSSEPKSMS